MRQVRPTNFAFRSWDEYYKQITTKNHRKERGPIKKEKLAFEVAKCIELYLKVSGQRNSNVVLPLIQCPEERNPLSYPLRGHVPRETSQRLTSVLAARGLVPSFLFH